MIPINCKYSFVTISDTIYLVLNCTYWNFIIDTLHMCFKLINILNSCPLSFFLIIPHTFSIWLMPREWGGPASISISQLMYHFKVSTYTCLVLLSIYRTNLLSKISLIFGRISETHSIYFLVHIVYEENQRKFCFTWNWTLYTYFLVSRFSLFFMKLLTWKYPSFTIWILCIQMRFIRNTYLTLSTI